MKSRTVERKPSGTALPTRPGGSGEPAHPADGPGSSLIGFFQSWGRFWFSPADPIVLGFIRIVGGILILYVHLCYSFDLMSYVGGERAWVDRPLAGYLRKGISIRVAGDDFLTPVKLVANGSHAWSIFYHVSDPFWIWTLHFTFLGIILLFTLGLWTRMTAALTWFACLSYIQRAPILLFGMDTMMSILMFYMLIGPVGATLSLDRLIEIWQARRRFGPNYLPPVQPSVSANVALRGMQIHFCLIYIASGTSKLLGPRWWAGTSLWWCYSNYSFAPLNVPLYYETLVYLCKHRWLWELVMSSGVVFTLFMECSFIFLVWLPRWRWLMVSGAVLLHTGIGLFMGLVTFSLFMLCLVASFIPPEAIHQLVRQLTEGNKPKQDAKAGTAAAKGKPALALTRT